MAKSKNHTAHNQSFKDHRNGIKKPKKQRMPSKKGVSQSAISVKMPYDVSVDGQKVSQESGELQMQLGS